jgi:hypothetical protein
LEDRVCHGRYPGLRPVVTAARWSIMPAHRLALTVGAIITATLVAPASRFGSRHCAVHTGRRLSAQLRCVSGT